jgi:hypothetical protein
LPVDSLLELRRQVGHLSVDLDVAISAHTIDAAAKNRGPREEPDTLLTPDQAASIAGVNRSWLIRNSYKLPFARKLSHKVLRFSEVGLRRWLVTRRP